MRSALARPPSRWVELIRQRPGAVCRATSSTSSSVESITNGARTTGASSLDQPAHQASFIRALGQGHAEVQAVRAAVHLLAGDGQGAIKIFGQDASV